MSNYLPNSEILPEKPQNSRDKTLNDMVNLLRRENLKIPKFQRDFCWAKSQVHDWIESVKDQKAIGVIVTYQLKGGGDTYLADGLQRLTATKYFIDDPSHYGFEFSTEQAIAYCESFDITVQHRIYNSHEEAMIAFRKLNSGTSLVRGEFFAGEIALIPDVGDIITKRIPDIIKKYESIITKKPTRGRSANDKLLRDCYAIFLQYISKTTSTSFWDSGTSSTSSKKIPVEQELARFIKEEKIKTQRLNDYIDDFDRFIAGLVASVGQILEEVGGKGLAINNTVMRWYFHLSVWRKNSNRPYQPYRNLVCDIFKYQLDKYGEIRSKFSIVGKNEKEEDVVLQLGNLDLSRICRVFNSELYDGSMMKRKKSNAAPGYHASHIEPFSQLGDGPTFPEPAPDNISRGAKPVQSSLL